MDKIVSSVAALGIPGVVLVIAVGATGYAGAAALTTALAALGPGGMVGGLITLGVIGLISKGITEYGVDAIFTAVVRELVKRGETIDGMKQKISKYPISPSLKAKLNEELSKLARGDA